MDRFTVGHMPGGEARSLVAYGWINENERQRYIMPILLVDCNCRVYCVYGVCELSALVDVIRKDHYWWLYNDYRPHWEKEMKAHEGLLYRDFRAELAD